MKNCFDRFRTETCELPLVLCAYQMDDKAPLMDIATKFSYMSQKNQAGADLDAIFSLSGFYSVRGV